MNRTNDPGTSNRSRILRPAGVLAGSLVLLVVAGMALVNFALRPEGRGEAGLDVVSTAHGGRDTAQGLGVRAQSSNPATDASSAGGNGMPLTVTGAAEARSADVAAAERAFASGNYPEAATLFAAVAAQNPDEAWGHYMLGLSQWKCGRTEQAEVSLVQALDRDPYHVKSLINLARVRLERGEAQKALVPISRAVEIEPTSVEAHRVHGRVLHNLGVGPQAEMAYVRALAIDPQDAWTLNNLGLLWIEAGEFTEALGPLARAVQVEPAEARIWNNLGVALERSERYGAATQAYAKALEADSTFARARVSLIRVRPHVAGQSWPDPDLTQLASEFDPSKPLLAAIRGMEDVEAPADEPAQTDADESLETSEVLVEEGEPLAIAPVSLVSEPPVPAAK